MGKPKGKGTRLRKRLIVEVSEDVDEVMVVHPNGHVDRIDALKGDAEDEDQDEDQDEDEDEDGDPEPARINYLGPTVRKEIHVAAPRDLAVLELETWTDTGDGTSSGEVFEQVRLRSGRSRHDEEKLSLEVPEDVACVVVKRDGEPARLIWNPAGDWVREARDALGVCGPLMQIDIPPDVDQVRVQHGVDDDEVFPVFHGPKDPDEMPGEESPGYVKLELVISGIPRSDNHVFGMECRHPDGRHATIVELDDPIAPWTELRIKNPDEELEQLVRRWARRKKTEAAGKQVPTARPSDPTPATPPEDSPATTAIATAVRELEDADEEGTT